MGESLRQGARTGARKGEVVEEERVGLQRTRSLEFACEPSPLTRIPRRGRGKPCSIAIR